jgi:uncharacterized protein
MTAPRFEGTPPGAGPRIQGFAGRRFLVAGQAHDALLLTPETARDWSPPLLAELTAADVELVLALDPPPEFLLLGTGPATAFLPPAFTEALAAKGIGVEPMNSRAAARAWGLLRSEGRWIAAALMPL